MRRYSIITFWAAVIMVGVAVTAAPAFAQTNSSSGGFIPELPIPGQFEGTQTLDNNLFGRYVRAIYVYFIWTVGIVATGMITFAGVKWVAAAGDQGRIRDARDMITNAIIGVIIALTSVVLLNLLSPGFTTLSIPGAKKVVGDPYDTASPLYYKDANGNCLPAAEIPCGLTCTKAETGEQVRGACTYCQAKSSIRRDEQLCGTLSKDPEVLAKDGNCVHLVCENASQACTVSPGNFGTTLGSYFCKNSTELDLTSGGYQASIVNYSRNYPCGELWYEKASNGILGIGAHPERLYAGTKCSAPSPDGDTYQVCLYDLTQTASGSTPKSGIPDDQDTYKIGSWPLAKCY